LFGCQNEQDFTTHTPASLSPEYQPDGVRSEDKAQEMMQLALEKGSYFFEWTHRKVDGTDFPATVLLSRLESGGTQLLQATVRDITERKKIEQEIARIARDWEVTFNATSDGICLIDANQNLIRCNTRMSEILGGMRQEDLVNKPCWVVVHKTTGPIPECPFVSAKKTLKRTRVEIPVGDLWFEVTADPVLDSSGTFTGAVHIMRDITERKHAEEERARLAVIVEQSDEAIIGKTLEGIITSWNIGSERMYGYSAQEIVGKSVSLLVPPDHPDDTMTILERVKNGEPVIRYETLRRKKDGGLINVTLTASPVRDTQNRLVGISVIGHDITERKRAEEALMESKALVNAVVENVPLMIFLKEATDLRFVLFNRAGEELLGYDRTALLGKNNLDLFPPEQAAHFMTKDREVLDGELIVLDIPEESILTAKKGLRLLHTWKVCIRGADGTTKFLLGISEDITDRKLAEHALQQANKQLNLLSSITRHDILNQLMALKGYLYLSKEMIDDPMTLAGYFQKEEQAADAIENQIKFTRDYQELGVAAPKWQNVNASIHKADAGLQMRDIHVEVDPKNPEVFADQLFEKVFYNLIDNALRYGDEGMKTIRVSSQESNAGLLIVCEDDGVGISAEDKKKLFTRGFGKNTGLGLFLSREILAITGITITENGEPGKGARFEIAVPKGAYRFTGTGGK
jgi:PAS domain S-box-containing protein